MKFLIAIIHKDESKCQILFEIKKEEIFPLTVFATIVVFVVEKQENLINYNDIFKKNCRISLYIANRT